MVSVHIGNGSVGIPFSLFDAQIFLLILHSFAVYNSVSETAGPSVLIIGPGVHTVLFTLPDTCFHIGKPLPAHVFRLESASCMHKKAPHSPGIHLFHLPHRFLCIQFFIPGPERYRTILFGYVFAVYHSLFSFCVYSHFLT